jgi:tetratricopeptide (TPR) repeat protein
MFANLFKRISEFWRRGRAPLKTPNNPYVTGNVVGGGPAFVGRTDILQGVKEQLRSPQQNAIVLYGQRRIGKTSVLRELEAKLSKDNCQVIYFDLMGKATLPLQTILSQLADEICFKLSMTKPDVGKIEFHAWLASVVNEDKFTHSSLIILFDEFDSIDAPHAEQARDEFFHYLREKLLPVVPQKLKFVFAIGRNISDFQSALVLLRTMSNYHVSLLIPQQETEKLIRLSENNNSLRWSKAAIQKIWELTHGHPYLTQLLCHLIFEQLWAKPRTSVPTVSRKVVEELIATKENLEKVFEKAVSALEWLWEGLPPACKIDAAAFAELGNRAVSQKELVEHLYRNGVGIVVSELETAPKSLKDWDIIEEDESNNYQFRVELFRQWVKLHKPLKDILQQELGRIRVKAQEYYQRAQTAQQAEHLDEAIENLRTAIRLNPQFIEAHQLLATVFQDKGDFAEAQVVLEKFYSCCPDMARSQLTEFLWKQAESSTNRKEKLEWCEKILSYDPNHSTANQKRKEVLLWQAGRFEEDGEYGNAMNAFAKAGDAKEASRVWRKKLWEQYKTWVRALIGFIVGLGLSYLLSQSPLVTELVNFIPWWVWGSLLGIFIALLVVILPLRRSPRKRL